MRTLPPLIRDPRYSMLDLWRGVACLMVVLYHAGFALYNDLPKNVGWDGRAAHIFAGVLWRLNLGVSLFFVISGYCIAASVDATRRRGSGAWRFLGRRVWRIYPPYWASVVVYILVLAALDALGLARFHSDGRHALQLDSPSKLDAVQWVGNLTLTEEWRPLVWRPPFKNVFTRVAWSLCYEEQFYFVCFVALLAASRRLYAALATITLLTVAGRVVMGDIGRVHYLAGAFPFLWHEFAVGLAVYVRLNVPLPGAARRALELGLVALCGLGLTIPQHSPIHYSTAAAAAFGLLLIALRRVDETAARVHWLGPLRACGRRCYSIYLVHLPVCVVGSLALYELGLTGFWARGLVLVPLVSAVAVGAGWLFFGTVERHFLNVPIVAWESSRAEARGRPLAGEISG